MKTDNGISAAPAHRILVVDDNRDAADALIALLSVFGFEASAVHSGALALAYSRQWRPRLIFLDLDMPDMDGFETLRLLRSQGLVDATRVVALTARSSARDRELCKDEGFDHFVCKPIDTDFLCELAAGTTRES